MLGQMIHDPEGHETVRGSVPGLGLLPADTVMTADKVTRVRRATIASGVSFPAYEIHLGVTTCSAPLPPFARLEDDTHEGAVADRVIGTYLHGALADARACASLFRVPIERVSSGATDYDALADWFEQYAENRPAWLPVI
jgi:adenosylcobyric acid synthase